MALKGKDIELFYPDSPESWRAWLEANHAVKQSVWVVYYKKNAGMPTINQSLAADQALCFGWIDSIARPLDDKSYMQFFSPRKPKSTWSKVNKQKVAVLLEAGLITKAGLESIAIAKQNGSWELLDQVEELILPDDLNLALEHQPEAMIFYSALSRSVKKAFLQWLVLARQAETRQNRITEIVRFCIEQTVPKQFRP